MPQSDSPLKALYDRGLWIRAGQAALFIIRDRTMRGKFLNADADPNYSTKPAPIGLGRTTKTARAKIERLIERGKEDPENAEAKWIVTKGGDNLVILKNGYKQLRELSGKQTDKVTLTWSGRMLGNLKVRVPGGIAGFNLVMTDPELAKILDYHNRLGAGKSKKVRRIIGWTDTEMKAIVRAVEKGG